MQAKAAELELRTAHLKFLNERRLSRDLTRRTAREQVTALNLTQFATQTAELNVSSNELENLLYTLEVCANMYTLYVILTNMSISGGSSTGSDRQT